MPAIACSCSALGALGIVLSESTGASGPRTFNASSIRHEVMYENLGTRRAIEHTNSITGSLSKLSSGARQKSYLVQGTIAIQPSPKQLTTWLPRIFGGPITGTSVAVTDNIPSFDVLVYRENGIFQYVDCYIAQAMLRGKTSNGGDSTEFMELLLSIVGKTENPAASWPGTEPELAVTADYLPYTFPETIFEIGSDNIEYESISIMIDNNLDVRLYNKPTPQCIRSTGRDIKIELQSPFTCANLADALALNAGDESGEFAMEFGTMSTSFVFPALRNAFETPTISGKQSLPLKFNLEAYSTPAAREVVITHDDTI